MAARPQPRRAIAAGQVVGAAHRARGQGGQDALAIRQDDDALVAVVADGCGSAPHSQLGAHLGARWAAEAVGAARRAGCNLTAPAAWELVATEVSARVGALADSLGGDPRVTLAESLLFTLLATVVTDEIVVIAGLGDGVYSIDGAAVVIEPRPGNRPPYLSYRLVPDLGEPAAFTVHEVRAAAEIDEIVLATDGAVPLAETGMLAALVAEPIIYRNPDALRRRLAIAARPVCEPDWTARRMRRGRALLHDDTAVIAIRRCS